MSQLLGNLAVGARVKDVDSKLFGSSIIFQVADKGHSGYPTSSVTLLSEHILSLQCFDAKEPSNPDSNRKNYGNNNYKHSNLRSYLNSNSTSWYSAKHATDMPPNTAGVSSNAYDTRQGFLLNLSENMRNSLLLTDLKVAKNTVVDGGNYETVQDKVFLLSNTEVGLANENSIAEGTKLALFSDNNSRISKVTAACVANSNYSSNPAADAPWYWWLRTPNAAYSYYARYVYTDGSLYCNYAYNGNIGVRPALNLLSSILVSDTTDSDGAYTIIWNRPPTTPTVINVPDVVLSSQSVTISCSTSTDPDGDAIQYRFERRVNGGTWTEVKTSASTSCVDTPNASWNSVQWRVLARDSKGADSGYKTSETRTVVHNQPPIISGTNGDLGVKVSPFTHDYTVTDADNDVVTVVERIDGETIRTFNPVLGDVNKVNADGAPWLKANNGQHNLTITANDGKTAAVVRTLTFTKNVNGFGIELLAPLSALTMPSKIKIDITREIPAGATMLVQVCNNAFDAAPTWEDATAAVNANITHLFTNKLKVASNWGVNIKITVTRGDAVGACWVSGLGGNFE